MEQKTRGKLVGMISVLAGIATIITAAVTPFDGEGSSGTGGGSDAGAARAPTDLPSFSAAVATDEHALDFIRFLADHHSEIVELEVAIDSISGYLKSAQGAGSMYFFAGGPEDVEYEVSFVGYSPHMEHGSYMIDGFFLVHAGGLYQGVLTMSLEHVPRKDVLLSR